LRGGKSELYRRIGAENGSRQFLHGASQEVRAETLSPETAKVSLKKDKFPQLKAESETAKSLPESKADVWPLDR